MAFKNGGIAQLGERLNGIQEVSGSIPLISTMETGKTRFDASQNEFFVSRTDFLGLTHP